MIWQPQFSLGVDQPLIYPQMSLKGRWSILQGKPPFGPTRRHPNWSEVCQSHGTHWGSDAYGPTAGGVDPNSLENRGENRRVFFWWLKPSIYHPKQTWRNFWGERCFYMFFFFEVKMCVCFCEGTNCLTKTVACEANSLTYCHLKIFKRMIKIVNARN